MKGTNWKINRVLSTALQEHFDARPHPDLGADIIIRPHDPRLFQGTLLRTRNLRGGGGGTCGGGVSGGVGDGGGGGVRRAIGRFGFEGVGPGALMESWGCAKKEKVQGKEKMMEERS